MALESLGISEASALLSDGRISAVELATDCLQRVDAHEADIQAWAWLDRDHVLRQAEAIDEIRRQGKALGRLHGIPIGIKDIIDTALIPTEHGSPLFSGRLPKQDAVIVERLRQQGAIMMGKTVTCAFATFMAGKTTNPHNAQHTPGGSSSGSAAAVASFMVPAAIGTQTNGSVIRPAAFCGTVGFKPSFGLIPRTGVLTQSPFLDQVGVFTRSVEDAALLAEVLIGDDGEDLHCARQIAPPQLQSICLTEPPLPPKFALIKTSAWDNASEAVHSGFDEVVEALGNQLEVVDLTGVFDQVWDHLKTVNEAEMAHHYAAIYERGQSYLDAVLKGQIERGQKISTVEYLQATSQRPFLNTILDELFDQFDALLTPAALSEAPKGLDKTGDPVFCTPWTFCGVPAVTLPLLQGENGLPVGVQLVGARYDDARLLRAARWLNQFLLGEPV